MQPPQTNRYAVQLLLPEESEQAVAALQHSFLPFLGNKVLSFSKPHISLFNFLGKLPTLNAWIAQLDSIITDHQAIKLCFNRWAIFSNAALVLLPDEASFDSIKNLIKNIDQQQPNPIFGKTKYPHITIARHVDLAHQEQIKEYMTNEINVAFTIQQFSIVQYDKQIKKHVPIAIIPNIH